jgi:ATP-dependent Lhr-like helicase
LRDPRPLRDSEPEAVPHQDDVAWFTARRLLERYGVLARRLLVREKIPVPWRDIARACRLAELRGDVRGGRFANGLAGEQFAHLDAVAMLRSVRKREPAAPASVGAADPLNLEGILTPSARVAPQTRRRVMVG